MPIVCTCACGQWHLYRWHWVTWISATKNSQNGFSVFMILTIPFKSWKGIIFLWQRPIAGNCVISRVGSPVAQGKAALKPHDRDIVIQCHLSRGPRASCWISNFLSFFLRQARWQYICVRSVPVQEYTSVRCSSSDPNLEDNGQWISNYF